MVTEGAMGQGTSLLTRAHFRRMDPARGAGTLIPSAQRFVIFWWSL